MAVQLPYSTVPYTPFASPLAAPMPSPVYSVSEPTPSYSVPGSFSSIGSYGMAPAAYPASGQKVLGAGDVWSEAIAVPLGTTATGEMLPATAAAGEGGFLKNTFLNENGGLNFGALGTLAEGIAGLGSMWAGFKQNKLAGEMFDFQKKSYDTNLANQLSSYNTALEDQVRARHHQEGRSSTETDRYISKHQLKA